MQAAHITRQSLEPRFRIVKIDNDKDEVLIHWEDGHQSLFHAVWLRDNCSCDQCGDHSGGHRFFELNMLPESLGNTVSDIDGVLRIEWTADGHVTHFDPAWLRSHCCSHQERTSRRHQPVLWDATFTKDLPRVNYTEATKHRSTLLEIYDAVRTYGICLLSDVPKYPAATEEIASLLSFVRETHYGRVFEIISTPNPVVIANAPVPLRPHTDENFREPPPGIMLFHSIKASEDGGGESVMTDGFRLAEEYKKRHPDEYELLTRVTIPHRRFIEGVGLRAEAPIIKLGEFNL